MSNSDSSGSLFITTLFDPDTEAMLRALQNRIRTNVTDQSPLPRHRPHVTLAAYDASSSEIVRRSLEIACSRQSQFSLSMKSIGVFPQNRTIFAQPVPTLALLDLHVRIKTRYTPGYPTR